MAHRCVSFFVLGGLIGCLALVTTHTFAAPPKLNYLFPAGAARASSVVLKASGEFPRWPVKFWTRDAGITAASAEEKGKLNLTVSEGVAPGVHWLRCFDDEGASSPRPLIIGSLPEVEETEPNDTPEKPHRLSDCVTINGRLAKNNDVDCFSLELRAGQTLVASVEAHQELASPMDAVLQICMLTPNRSAAASGALEAFVLEQIDDCIGLDPRLVFHVPRDGSYLLRLFSFPKEPNSTIGFAGGENFLYRLTLTTAAFVEFARPVAIQAEVPTIVELNGWNIPGNLRSLTVVAPQSSDVFDAFHSEIASFARLAVVDHPVVDYDPTPGAKPQPVAIPVTITGLLKTPRQRDTFVFQAVKGEKIRLQVVSRTLGFAAAAIVVVTDESGKNLTENEEGRSRRSGGGSRGRSRQPNPDMTFTAPADGQYHVVVSDTHGQASGRHVYRLTLDKLAPDFDLSIANDSFVLTRDKPLEIPVKVERQNDFAEPIQFVVEGLPSGTSVAPVTSEKEGDSAKEVKLVISTDATSPAWQGAITVFGVTSGERAIKRVANYTLAEFNVERSDVWLTIAAGKK